MARPKLGETDTERLHVKMTADEIQRIDDWRYASKIPSRSEAVRRLCQVGLFLGSQVEDLTENAEVLSDAITTMEEQAFDAWSKVASPVMPGDVLSREGVKLLLENMLDNIAEVGGGIEHLSQVLTALYVSIVGMANLERDEAKKKTTEAMVNLNATLAKLEELRSSMKENRIAMREYGYRPRTNASEDEK